MKNQIHRSVYCCACINQTNARLTSGKELYPHRPDLAQLNFWKCDKCNNFVGCHNKSKNPTEPLGFIPTPELKKARVHIHAILDPLWKPSPDEKGKAWRERRGKIYRIIAREMNIKEYHTAQIRTIEEAREVYKIVKRMPELLAMSRQIELAYMAAKPVQNREYLIRKDEDWVEATFIKRQGLCCQLHGDLYAHSYFFKINEESYIINIDVSDRDSLIKRTQDILKNIKAYK
jgi:hypothetical protein